jgi:hypothetical protein
LVTVIPPLEERARFPCAGGGRLAMASGKEFQISWGREGREGEVAETRRGGKGRVGSLFSLFFCLFFLSLFDLGFLVAKTLEKVSNVGVNKQNENGEKMEEHGSCVCFF